MTDELESRLGSHFRARLDAHRPLPLTLPPRNTSTGGWRVGLVAGLAAAVTLLGLGQRSTPVPVDSSPTAVANTPMFVPIASQFISTGDELGTVYVDDAPMQLIRTTGIHRTEYATADGQTRLSIAVPAHDVFLTHRRVD